MRFSNNLTPRDKTFQRYPPKMAALLRDVTNLADSYRRPSNATSESASASPSDSPSASPPPPSASSQLLEGLEDKIQRYSGISRLRRAIQELNRKLQEGETTDQYLVFRPVTMNERDEIENRRREISNGMRLTHCADVRTLIIKVPTPEHEAVSRTFGDVFVAQAIGMRVPLRERFRLGSTTFKGTSTSKEADESFKPGTIRPHRMDWPTLVLEAGVSESLLRLRNDAKWWLTNSEGNVNIVLIFHINRAAKSILIEKWENVPAAAPATRGPPSTRTRSYQTPTQIPTQMEAITIDENNVTGAPLTLHFHKVFLRQPNPPEHDMVFTAQDLQDWSDDVWALLT